MSGRQDGGLRAEVHRRLRPLGVSCWAVETGGTTQGVPDTYWLDAETRAAGWLELKVTDGWAVEVRPHQAGFLVRHAAAGLRAAILVRARGAGSGGAGRDALWIVPGRLAGELASGDLRSVRAESSVTPWGQVDWGLLRTFMVRDTIR